MFRRCTYFSFADRQKKYFSPNCISRLLLMVDEILPKVALPTVAEGALNCGVLGEVECLPTKLQPMPFCHPEFLEKRKIPGLGCRSVEEVYACVPIPKWSDEYTLSSAAITLCSDERLGVEPAVETAAFHSARNGGSRRDMGPGRTVGACVVRVAILGDVDRQSGRQLHDPVYRPPSE
jgi:hypothetical protein